MPLVAFKGYLKQGHLWACLTSALKSVFEKSAKTQLSAWLKLNNCCTLHSPCLKEADVCVCRQNSFPWAPEPMKSCTKSSQLVWGESRLF